MGRRAILLDRDGTVCEEVGYVNHVDRVRLIPGSAEAIARANAAGFQTVVFTNQAGAARGYFPEALIGDVHDRMRELLEAEGARIDGIYYCAHEPEARCDCRKPRPGMLLRAAAEMGLDLGASYVVGDHGKDLDAGRAVGATPILVRTGYGAGQLLWHAPSWKHAPTHVADDLRGAVDWILGREGLR